MSLVIVHPLEMSQIDHAKRRSFCADKSMFNRRSHGAAIEQAGQSVDNGR
jgi:hypothetical protein